MKFGERLEAAMQHLGWGPSELSKSSGVAMPTISALTRRASDRTNYKEALIKGFPAEKINHDWLATGRGEMTAAAMPPQQGKVIALHPEDDVPEDVVQIPEYRVKFSGGNGSSVVSYELSEEVEPATYRLSWMQRMRLNPEKLKRFKVKGDSMEPLLFSGDSVLVNLAENDIKEIQDGKVYAIRYGSELRVKRLYRRLDGGLTLRSYNPEYKDEDLAPDLVTQHITVIGRVRDKSGAGGL